MPAYLVADIEVTDPDRYRDYAAVAPATMDKYGGRYLARGGATETLEGDWPPRRIVIAEFESVAQAKAWYDSPEYRAARSRREGACQARFVVVEGVA